MFDIEHLRTDNKDIIHNVGYDYYGKRVATCHSDQTVKIWDLDDADQWYVSGSWKAHAGIIWRVSWAHPEFGQVIATCSFDRTVSIWEEIVGEKPTTTSTGQTKRWVRRTALTDSRTSVTDCKFAPKTLGLMLATASLDGIIRIYEAPDLMNLSQWTIQHEITCKASLSCLTWNISMYMLHSPLIAAGSDETTAGGKVFLFEYSENARKWSKIETISNISDSVYDIAFAPNLGRTYHRLAVASKDLHILNIKPIADSNGVNRLEVQTVAQFNDHYCQVWRVCWNVTGTMLASSGDDGCVRIWKMNEKKNWICYDILKSNGLQPPQEVENVTVLSSDNGSGTNQYKIYKRGNIITNATQVPWH